MNKKGEMMMLWIGRCYSITIALVMGLAVSAAHGQYVREQNEFLAHVSANLYTKQSERMPLKNHVMNFRVATVDEGIPLDVKTIIAFVDNGGEVKGLFPHMPSSCIEGLRALCNRRKFQGQAGEHLIIPVPHSVHSKIEGDQDVFGDPLGGTLILVGIGDRSGPLHEQLEGLRRAVGHALHVLKKEHVYNVGIMMPDREWFVERSVIAREIVTTMLIAEYTFDTYFSQKQVPDVQYAITLVGDVESVKAIANGVYVGMKMGHAVNQSRYWADCPPSVATPSYMAEAAEELARTCGLVCTVFDQHHVKAIGMGGLSAVAQGSAEPCRFVVLEYWCALADAPTVALVGKGITFDTGGISLKPAANMEDMKYDMAGAAAIMAAMELIAEFKPAVNVIAILPFAENMPSGSAARPGDIVRFYNGVTAEIKNTDAEGRLILADALSYAVKNYSPDVIIDIATLTGSCLQSLGHWFAGLMTQHSNLADRIIEAGYRSGDRVWPLPLHNDYKAGIKSTVADIANLGPSFAGAINAAFFLQYFVGKTPWAHLDIAGTAWDIPLNYYNSRATGFGVRLLVDYVMNWSTNV